MLNQIRGLFSLICIASGLGLVYLADSKSVVSVLGGATVLALGFFSSFFVLRDWLKWQGGSSKGASMKKIVPHLLNLQSDPALAQGNAAVRALEAQGISFSARFLTPGGKVVFVIEQGILLESEILTLADAGDLTREGIRKLICQLRDSGKIV
jgi:hypothetical protein